MRSNSHYIGVNYLLLKNEDCEITKSEFGKFLNVLTRYEQKKDLLNNISYDDKPYFQCLVRKWKDDSSLYRVQGNLFFSRSYKNHD